MGQPWGRIGHNRSLLDAFHAANAARDVSSADFRSMSISPSSVAKLSVSH
jgi:hypothetical protein